MNIAYDHQIFTEQRFGGISRYFVALATEINRLGARARIIAPLHVNRHLRAAPPGIAIGAYVPQIRGTGSLIRRVDGALLGVLTARIHPDVMHETYYSEARTFAATGPVVTTVYDMVHERYPIHLSADDGIAARKGRAVQRADHVICISENTRRDLIDVHRIPEHRVSVIHLACDALDPRGEVAASVVGPQPYLLHVGVRGGYKNFARLVEAFAGSRQLKDAVRLVCLGGGQMSASERAGYAALGLSDRHLVQVHRGDDATLAALYVGAAALVYPSLYEGFGIPVLEAMSLGCPVACSDTSSLPEVAGDAAQYFDPTSAESMRAALEALIGSDARRRELASRGRERAAVFSWARCARETLDVYRSVM